ncbi:MAG: TonB-dependent receptor [Porphyromonas sp.]|nr:TonB-dependent receptor [Porphyromonas sp.]
MKSRKTHPLQHLLLLVLLLFVSPSQVSAMTDGGAADDEIAAGKGRITGTVLDDRGETIPGATVKVVNGPAQGKGTTTSLDGEYRLELDPGVYTIEVSFIGFETKQITGIEVSMGASLPLDVVLGESSELLEEVVITASYNNASAEGLYARQKAMITMSDGLSASMIKRTSDNNIAQSLRRISGVTITGGKHVTVRGMSDRYNNVTLNGSSLPSTEANQRNFSFDIIPTGLVDNIIINKTFTPDLPGEFTGGLIEIKTLTVPESEFLNVSIGTGMNTLSTGKPFRLNNRYTSDWFFGEVKDRKWFAGSDNIDESVQNAIPKNNYDMYLFKGMPTQTYSFTFGKPFKVAGQSFGVVGSLTYRHEENTQEYLDGTALNTVSYIRPFGIESLISTKHTATSNIGAVLNLGWKTGDHKVTLRNLFNSRFSHLGQFSLLSGDRGPNAMIGDDIQPTLQYYNKPVRNIIFQTQLEGEHKLLDEALNLTWLASFNSLHRVNPDDRLAVGIIQDQVEDDELIVLWTSSTAESQRYNAATGHTMYMGYREYKGNAGFNLEYPFIWMDNKHTLKAGFLGTFRSAQFEQLYIKASVKSGIGSLGYLPPLAEVYAPERFGNDLIYTPTGNPPADRYNGYQQVYAPYFMGTFSFMKKLQVTAGMRVEINDIKLQQETGKYENNRLTYKEREFPDHQVDWLPSITATYSIIPDLNLKGSYGKTIARPDFRELTEMRYTDPETRTNVYNSKPIEKTDIDNYDVRLEWYPRIGEVLSIGYFHKRFINPVETFQRVDNKVVGMVIGNLESATVNGVELNWRKSFDFIMPELENLYLTGNYTWMTGSLSYNYYKIMGIALIDKTEESLFDRDRILQGLTPYTFNMGLLYEGAYWGASVHYNQVGRKLVYARELPREDLYENPRGILDLQLYARFLDKRMELKVNVTDLLNQDIIQYANMGGGEDPEMPGHQHSREDLGLDYNDGDFLFSRVNKGIGISCSVSYKF